MRLHRPSRRRTLAAGVLLMSGLAVPAFAATPAEQTVTPSATSGESVTITWTGTLTGGANADSACRDQATTSSDTEKITLNVPAGFYDSHTVQATFSATPDTPSADIILSVQDPSDSYSDSDNGAVGGRESVGTSNPAAGLFSAITCVFAGGPATYTGTLTLTTDPVTGVPGGFGTAGVAAPTYTNYAAPDGLGEDAGEPSLGVNYTTDQDNGGTTLFQAGLDVLKVVFDNSATPATASWTDVSPGSQNPCADISLDPIGEMDSSTGRYFDDQLSGNTSLLCFTDDNGQTYNSASTGGGPSGVDHQTVGVGPFPAGFLPTGDNPVYPHAVYYCSQYLQGAFCNRSDTGGVSFVGPFNVYTSGVSDPSCGGLHGHVMVAPDGTVYLPNKACGDNQGVAVSTDAGMNWSIQVVPASTPGNSDPAVGTDSNSTLYYGYIDGDGDGHPKIATSDDRGANFTTPVDVGAPFGLQNGAFPQVVGGDDGRAAMAFLGTPTGGTNTEGFGDPDGDGVYEGAEWHLYVATTLDGGVTWTTVDATPKDPVQRGEICQGGISCTGNTRNLLDFNDVTLDRDGRVEVAYADGCTGTCLTSMQVSDNPHTAKATIARSSTGTLLFAAPGGTASGPGAVVPEAPLTALIPIAAMSLIGGAYVVRRRRALGTA